MPTYSCFVSYDLVQVLELFFLCDEIWMMCNEPRAFQVAHWVKNLPSVQESQEPQFQSLGQNNPLEWGTAILNGQRIQWTEKTVGYFPQGYKESDITEVTDHA